MTECNPGEELSPDVVKPIVENLIVKKHDVKNSIQRRNPIVGSSDASDLIAERMMESFRGEF